MSWCRCTAALGVPVVPDVYSQKATSSLVVAAGSSSPDSAAERSQRVAARVGAAPPVAVGDAPAAVMDGEPAGAAFGDVAVDEPGGGIEGAGDVHGSR